MEFEVPGILSTTSTWARSAYDALSVEGIVSKKSRKLELPIELGSVDNWQAVQRRLAARAVMASMIAAPKLSDRARAVAVKMMDGDNDVLREEANNKASRAVRRSVRSLVRRSARLTRNYAAPKAQRGRLRFDPGSSSVSAKNRPKLYGRESKSVLTAGLMLIAFDWTARLGHPLSLSDLKSFLIEKGAQAFWGNQISFYKSAVDSAWKEKRNVAHLCAAFAVFLDVKRTSEWRRFTEAEENDLIADIGMFLRRALWFQHVLLQVGIRAHATMKLNPRRLPSSFEIVALDNGGIDEIPENFRRAFEAWRTAQ